MESKKPLSLPSREITVSIKEIQYKIKVPNNGQLIDIERMKIDLSGGTLKEMLFGVGPAPDAYLMVSMIATLTVLIPDLKKDLAVKSLLELDRMQTKDIQKMYERELFPWLNSWEKVWNADDENEEDKKEEGK